MTEVSGYRGRFAPSPTGPLHFGSLLAAFASWLRARQARGVWLIRVEDLDPPREVAHAAQAQIDLLHEFGLVSDEPVVHQSERSALYESALAQLCARELAFPCNCSRSELAEQHGIHRFCIEKPPDRPAAFRARVPDIELGFDDLLQGPQRQSLAREVGDFVLRRVEGYYAYQLAVVVDDAAQGITEVVRGADLLDSTPRQIWLQQQLGLPTPAYLHLPLALDRSGAKLSKSRKALALDRDERLHALRLAWTFLGQDPSVLAGCDAIDALLDRAIAAFDIACIPTQNRRAP
jgi:glutamyl-Q tRNA(Asp) synthetase